MLHICITRNIIGTLVTYLPKYKYMYYNKYEYEYNNNNMTSKKTMMYIYFTNCIEKSVRYDRELEEERELKHYTITITYRKRQLMNG